jgi:hypothetical protein
MTRPFKLSPWTWAYARVAVLFTPSYGRHGAPDKVVADYEFEHDAPWRAVDVDPTLTKDDHKRNRQFTELVPLLSAWSRYDRVRNDAAPIEHQGATVDWSPTTELAQVDQREPEEMLAEAAAREASELTDHWAELEADAAQRTRAEFDAIVADNPWAAKLLDEARARLDAQATGEIPVIGELVAV